MLASRAVYAFGRVAHEGENFVLIEVEPLSVMVGPESDPRIRSAKESGIK